MNPSAMYDKFFAAIENNSKGITVTIPVPITVLLIPMLKSKKLLVPNAIRNINAKVASTNVSMNRLVDDVISTFFLVSPYKLNVIANKIAVHGKFPVFIARIITPIVANIHAIIDDFVMFSFKITTATSTFTSGFM